MTKETIKIHGKDYEIVASRINRFRVEKADWSINTSIVEWRNGEIIINATILDEKNNVRASGIAHEKEGATTINKTSYVEVCETSAIGRALACLNYQGGEYSSAEEITNALNNQTSTHRNENSSTAQSNSEPITEPQLKKIAVLVKKLNIDISTWNTPPEKLTKKGASKTIEALIKQEEEEIKKLNAEMGIEDDNVPF